MTTLICDSSEPAEVKQARLLMEAGEPIPVWLSMELNELGYDPEVLADEYYL